MKLAYFLLVHRDPVLFGRLVRQLNNPSVTSFIVHLDKKVKDISQYEEQVKDIGNVYFTTKRVNCCWGGFSLVQATLNVIQTTIENKIKYDYAIMMSGQDYPLKNNKYIHDFFKYSGRALYMEAFSPTTGTKEWQRSFFGSRLDDYYYQTIDGKSWYRYDGGSKYWKCEDARSDKTERAWIPCGEPVGLFDTNECKGSRKEHRPAFIKEWWGGSQWWALTKEAVEHIHAKVKEDDGYISFHKYTFIPDENFFQSLILNSDKFGKYVINNRLRFIDFSEPDPKNMPKTFGDEYLSELKEFCSVDYPMMLFARKFDSEKSARVLDEIDKLIK